MSHFERLAAIFVMVVLGLTMLAFMGLAAVVFYHDNLWYGVALTPLLLAGVVASIALILTVRDIER